MIVRPYGIVIDGRLEIGLEMVVDDESRKCVEIRPHTGVPDSFVLSPAFVNAHSHLEYRGMMGALDAADYWGWIRQITTFKKNQRIEDVAADALLGAEENKATGVAFIGEHSDRPVSAEALVAADLKGRIYQEVITFFEQMSPGAKLRAVQARAAAQREIFPDVCLAAHSPYTVDPETLIALASREAHLSIHVAETPYENELFISGTGPIADFYEANGFEIPVMGMTSVETLQSWDAIRPGFQFVHCCDIAEADIEVIAENEVCVAHCPRSNVRLQCTTAPIRELLDAGVKVGIGMDSAASSGRVDMFEEMTAALAVAAGRGKPIGAEEVWRMATTMGYESLSLPPLAPEDQPYIMIHLPDAESTEQLILQGSPELVEWLI